MTKKEINIFDYAGEIYKNLPRGILMTTEAEDCVNAMTIGWATIGIEWGVPIFTAYVRKSRFTHELIERTGEFTICSPFGENLSDKAKKIISICGSKSGRDTDKLAEVNATIIQADMIRPPAIKELPLTIECRVVYQVDERIKDISSKFKKFYPNEDPHTAYYGEILKAYIIEE